MSELGRDHAKRKKTIPKRWRPENFTQEVSKIASLLEAESKDGRLWPRGREIGMSLISLHKLDLEVNTIQDPNPGIGVDDHGPGLPVTTQSM